MQLLVGLGVEFEGGLFDEELDGFEEDVTVAV